MSERQNIAHKGGEGKRHRGRGLLSLCVNQGHPCIDFEHPRSIHHERQDGAARALVRGPASPGACVLLREGRDRHHVQAEGVDARCPPGAAHPLHRRSLLQVQCAKCISEKSCSDHARLVCKSKKCRPHEWLVSCLGERDQCSAFVLLVCALLPSWRCSSSSSIPTPGRHMRSEVHQTQ